MTTSELLSYDSLKSVLLHMEPNLRFKLSDQIPSIRCAEKATPLHVDRMRLESNQFAINDNVYKMEVVRQYRNCKTPETQQLVDALNKDAHGFVTFPYDVCENLIDTRDWRVEISMTPGDVDIDAVDQMEKEEQKLRDLQKLVDADRLMLRRLREAIQSKKIYKWVIDLEERLLFEFLQCEYSNYLKFTVKSTSEHVKYFDYNKKIPETMKYLYIKIFGGRICPIRVETFILKGGILRLPVNLKLRIQCLHIGQNVGAVCDALTPRIHESSFPLRMVLIDSGHILGEAENYKHQMIQNAKYMNIIGDYQQGQWLEMLLEISVEFLHLDCKKFPKGDFMKLIDNWLENGKEVGTQFSLGIDDKNNVKELLKSVLERPKIIIEEIQGKGCPTFPNVITIPMKNNAELCVHCYETTDEYELEECARWGLHFEVITAHHRHLWNTDFDEDVFE